MINYARRVKASVKKHGFHATYVAAESMPSFCYSTGLCETYAIPELFISSLPPGLSQELIQHYVKRFDGAEIRPNELLKKKKEPFDYYLIVCDPRKIKKYALATTKYYGDRKVEFLQLVFPDTAGYFPHHKRYDYDQEILGTFTPKKSRTP